MRIFNSSKQYPSVTRLYTPSAKPSFSVVWDKIVSSHKKKPSNTDISCIVNGLLLASAFFLIGFLL